MITIKRVYAPPSAEDGGRVLVDRLWPRGLRREAMQLDLWAKDASPSNELRKWYDHRPERWAEFQERYRAELAASPEAVACLAKLQDMAAAGPLTLLTATRQESETHADVLRALLMDGTVG